MSSSQSYFIISPWGDPGGWQYIRYRFEDSNRIISSYSSLIPIYLRYSSYNPRIYIIALDTLYASKYRGVSGPPDDYSEVIEASKEYISSKFHEFTSRYDIDVEPLIFIVPGVGSYNYSGYRYMFISSLSNLYLSTFLNILANILHDISNTSNANKINIVVDLTHGLNYMTTLVYEAVKDISDILLNLDYKVILEVYNSDPVGDERVIHLLSKQEVLDRKIPVWLNASKFIRQPHAYIPVSKDLKREVSRVFHNLVSKFWESIAVLEYSIENCLPLVLLTELNESLAYSIDRLDIAAIASIIESYRIDCSTVRSIDNTIIIQSRVIEDNEDPNDIVNAIKILSIIKNIARSRMGIGFKEYYSIDDIRYIGDILSRYSKLCSHFIAREIKEISELIEASRNRIGSLDRDVLYGFLKYGSGYKVGELDKRTFTAHCGLTYDTIVFNLAKDGLRYDQNVWSSIRERIKSWNT